MIFFSPNLLKLFLYNPQIQSIFTLSPFILHLFFVYSPFILRLFSIHSSSARAARTVFCSFIVRSLFAFCSSFVRLLFVFCSSFVRLLFVFYSSYLPIAFNFQPYSLLLKTFTPFISHLLIFKFANSTYPFTALYLLPFNPFINH